MGLVFAGSTAAGPPLFDAPFATFNTGPWPATVATADLDGDGLADLVVNSAKVLLSNGDRWFQHRTPFPAPGALGDLNGDGRPDLAAGGSNGVTVHLNTGGGAFGPGTSYGSGTAYSVIGVVDVDGNGRRDVVASISGGFAVFLGNGDGTLGARVDSPYSGWSYVGQTLGDLDHDGRTDLVLIHGRSLAPHPCWSVLPAHGNGTLGPAQPHGTCGITHYGDAAIGDLDGDGHNDVALVPGIHVHYGDGAFGFPRTSTHASGGGTAIEISDVDGDGRSDLLTANDFQRTVSVLLSRGGGAFAPHVDYRVGREPNDVAVGDFDGDGRSDLAAATWGCVTSADMIDCGGLGPYPDVPTLSVLFGRGGGAFGGDGITVTAPNAGWTALGDLDGDGAADLVTANGSSSTVSVMTSNGDGTFAPRVDYATSSAPKRVVLGDLNGDGRLDLVTPNPSSNDVSVRLGDGTGALGPLQNYPAGSSPWALAIGRIDADGFSDLVVANHNSGQVSFLPGNGDGSFGAPASYSAGCSPAGVAIGDLDEDGNLDVAVVCDFDIITKVLLGNGDGTFGAPQNVSGGRFPIDVALGRLNGDTHLDLVLANYGFGALAPESTVTVRMGTGDGTFGPATLWDTGEKPNAVVLADVEPDGRLDIVTSDEASTSVSVLGGNGDGTFREKIGFGSTGDGPAGISVGDVNKDGLLDLAMANTSSGTASVLLHEPDLATPTLLAMFVAEPREQGIELRWRLGDPTRVTDLALERREGSSGPWTRIDLEPRLGTEEDVVIDATALPDREYTYRLVGSIEGRLEVLGSVQTRSLPASMLGLLPISPSPTRGQVRIAYSLDRAADIRLSVCDIQGRVLSVLERGVRDAGRHEVIWSSRVGERAPGVYFVRLEVSGRQWVRRFVVYR